MSSLETPPGPHLVREASSWRRYSSRADRRRVPRLGNCSIAHLFSTESTGLEYTHFVTCLCEVRKERITKMASAERHQLTLPGDARPRYTLTLRVRQYEVDILGRVNNVVYLHYLEQVAVEHADSMGFTRARMAALGGLFVVHRHEVDYLGAAEAGDTLAVTTWVESFSGARATRAYIIVHTGTGKRIVTARTVWAWLDAHTAVPRPLPREIITSFGLPG